MRFERFARLPRTVMADKDLTPAAKIIYMAIHNHAWEDADRAWPSINTLAKESGTTTSTVKTALKALEKKGLVTIARRRDAPNGRKTNEYILTRIVE